MAALTLGLSALGNFYSGSVARRAQNRARRQMQAALQRALGIQGLYGELSQSQLAQGLATLGAGFDQARAEAETLGKSSYQRVKDQAVVARGQAQQNLLNTGFDRSNIANQVDRSLAADTARRNLEIDQGLAQLYSQLSVNKAQSEAAMRRAMSSQLQGQGDRLAGLEQGFAGMNFDLNTTSFQGPQFDTAALAETLKGVDWGSLFGGGQRKAGNPMDWFADWRPKTSTISGFSGSDYSSGDYSY